MCSTLAQMSDEHVRVLQPVADRYGESTDSRPIWAPRSAPCDLGAPWSMTALSHLQWCGP